MKQTYPYLLLLLLALLPNWLFAQTPFCASDAYHSTKLATDSIYAAQFALTQALIRAYSDAYYDPHNTTASGTRDVVVLPMVVHIVSPPGTPIGTGNNLSDAEVITGLNMLNDAFANAGVFNTPDGVNTDIQFCLAQRDPEGNLSNGITRHSSTVVAQNDCGGAAFNYGDEDALFALANWDCCQYINVYLVTDITGAGYGCSVAGYASVGSNCGFMVQESQYWNTVSGTQVTAHEMGHFFGLWHTFQGGCSNDDCLANGDAVCDTPPDNETFNACNANTCNTDSPDLPDDTQNYMDYGACIPWHFTEGQKVRMNATLETTQACLLNSMGCLSPCPAPLAANLTASATNIVVGTTVNFVGEATNASGYSYYINPAAPFANTLNSNYTFNSLGAFWVKFRGISNDVLCADAIDSVLINVSCNAIAAFGTTNTSINEGTTLNFNNNSTGGTSNAWTLNNVPVSNNADYSYTFSTAGSYYVCLTVSNAICSDIYCQTIGVAPDGVPTGCAGNTFQKSYGGGGDDIGTSVRATTDEGYIVAGYTKSYGADDNDGLLFKTNATGEVVWTKKIGIAGYNELLNDVKQTADGGYIAVGTYYPGVLANCTGSPDQIGIVWRLDANGNTLWLTKVDGTSANGESVNKVIEHSDGSFVFIGSTNTGCSVVDAMVGKLDTDGTVIWCKQWANTNVSSDIHTNLVEDTDGNIAIVGYTRSYHGDPIYDNYHNIVVSRASNMNGTLLWSHEYYGQNNIAGGNDYSSSIKILPNGNYLLSTVITPLYSWTNPALSSSGLLALDAVSGDIVWQTNFTFSNSNQATIRESLYNSTNGQIAYVFNNTTISTVLNDGTIGIGTASNVGNALNQTYLGYGTLYDIHQTNDEGYIVAGYQSAGGQRDIYLGKVNADLLTPGCENTPLDIVNTNRLFVKTTAGWTISNIDSYVQPNQSIATTSIDLTETGELCSTSCEEICANEIDDNNNGLIDENCPCPTLLLNADTSICVNQNAQLNASYGFDTYQWTPSTGLDNPNIRNPIASPTQSTNYTVIATKLSHNKIVNGDFSMGNVGFASGQIYSNTYAPCNYYVDNLWFGSLFPEGNDHTPTADGMYMHIDGCYTGATVLWQQTIADIIPNTNYKFSFWATEADVAAPIFDIHFIGNATGDNLMDTQTQTSFTLWTWDEHGIPIWNSGDNTELTIRIVNLNINSMGNDFGLDDFSLQQICSDTAHIQLNVLADSLIYQQNVICNSEGKLIISGVNGLPPYEYQLNGGAWQASGVFSPLAAGNYTLTTRDANGCTVTRNATIGTSNTPITLNIAELHHATCDSLGWVRIGIADSSSMYYQYVLDNLLAQTNGIFDNLAAGEHSVAVNNDLGCTATITFTINQVGTITDTLNQTTCNPANVGTVVDTLVAANGCDSIRTIITTLLPSITDTINQTTCNPANVGTVVDTLVAENGCDSIRTIITTLLLEPINDTINQTTCNPANVGTVVDTLVAVNGCDSIRTIITTLVAPLDCNDNDCNTTDIYDELTCQCQHLAIEPPICDDGNPNTLDTYDANTCACVHSLFKTIVLPNAFSPNGDGVNDWFGASGSSIGNIYLRIYNRWGQLIFESRDLNEAWNGKYKGFDCDLGIYVYSLSGAYNDGESFEHKGNITLVR
jgi:gliding motility-associated-like protein